MDCSNLFCESQLWGPAGQNRDHESHFKQERTMPCPVSCTSYIFVSKWSQVDVFQKTLTLVSLEIGHLCSSAGVLLLTAPAFLFQDMKEQWAWTGISHLFQSKYYFDQFMTSRKTSSFHIGEYGSEVKYTIITVLWLLISLNVQMKLSYKPCYHTVVNDIADASNHCFLNCTEISMNLL